MEFKTICCENTTDLDAKIDELAKQNFYPMFFSLTATGHDIHFACMLQKAVVFTTDIEDRFNKKFDA